MKKMSYLIHFGKEFLNGTKVSAVHPNVLYTMKDLVSQIRGDLKEEFVILLEGLDLPDCFLRRLEERKTRIREILSQLRKPIGTEMLDSFAIEDDGKSFTAESAFEDLKSALSDIEIRYVEFVQLQKTFRADVLLGRVPEMNDRSFLKPPKAEIISPSIGKAFVKEQKLISEVVNGVEALDRAKDRPLSDAVPEKKILQDLCLLLQDIRSDPLFGFTQCAFQLINSIGETVRDLECRVMDLAGKLICFRQRGKSSVDESCIEANPQFSAFLSMIQKRHRKSQYTLLDDRYDADLREVLVEWRTSTFRIGSFELEKLPSSEQERDKFKTSLENKDVSQEFAQHNLGSCGLYCNIF